MSSAIRVDLSCSHTLSKEVVVALAESLRRAIQASTIGATVTTDVVSVVSTPDIVSTVSTTALHQALATTLAAPTVVNGTAQATPSWNAVTNAIGYVVTVTNSTGGAATGVTGATSRFVPAGTLTLVFTGLTTGTAYQFKICPAFDAALGTYSPRSSSVTPT